MSFTKSRQLWDWTIIKALCYVHTSIWTLCNGVHHHSLWLFIIYCVGIMKKLAQSFTLQSLLCFILIRDDPQRIRSIHPGWDASPLQDTTHTFNVALWAHRPEGFWTVRNTRQTHGEHVKLCTVSNPSSGSNLWACGCEATSLPNAPLFSVENCSMCLFSHRSIHNPGVKLTN